MQQSRNYGCHGLSMTDWMSFKIDKMCGGPVVSWLDVCSNPDQMVQVQALARDIVLDIVARKNTFTVHLSKQVFKWVPQNVMVGVTLQWTRIPSRGGEEILLVASYYGDCK